MFKITQQQMSQFSDSCARGFEDRLGRHLGEFFSERCAALGASGVGELVRKGVRLAAEHGITAEKDVCLFVDLMCTFGERFDVDPKLPWAARILAESNRQKPSAKVKALCQQAAESLEQPEGEPGEDESLIVSVPDFAKTLPQAAQEEFSEVSPVGQPVVPCQRHKSLIYRFSL